MSEDTVLRPIYMAGRLIGYKDDGTGKFYRVGTIASSPMVVRDGNGRIILRGGTPEVLDQHMAILEGAEDGKESEQEQDEGTSWVRGSAEEDSPGAGDFGGESGGNPSQPDTKSKPSRKAKES